MYRDALHELLETQEGETDAQNARGDTIQGVLSCVNDVSPCGSAVALWRTIRLVETRKQGQPARSRKSRVDLGLPPPLLDSFLIVVRRFQEQH